MIAQLPNTRYAPSPMSEEQTEPLLRITSNDIADANQLSLGCPICAGAVEDNITHNDNMAPVKCTACSTFYHHACWHNNGGKCAILGCESSSFSLHGAQDLGPALVVSASDIRRAKPQTRPVVPSSSQIKKQEQRIQREVTRRYWWQNWFQRIFRAIRILGE